MPPIAPPGGRRTRSRALLLLLALECQLRSLRRRLRVEDGVGERRRDLGSHEIPGFLHLADLVAVLRRFDEIERKRRLAIADAAEDAQAEMIGYPDLGSGVGQCRCCTLGELEHGAPFKTQKVTLYPMLLKSSPRAAVLSDGFRRVDAPGERGAA